MQKISTKTVLISHFDTIKATLRKNRKLLFIGLAFVGIGFISGIIGIADYVENDIRQSIITMIRLEDFSIISFELTLILFVTLPVLICFIFSINYYLFLCSFGFIAVVSFYYFRFSFACFVEDFLYGLLSFLFVLTPVASIVFVGTILLVSSIFEIIRYPSCKKIFRLTPYAILARSEKKIFIKYLLRIALPAFSYANIVLVIIYLCCST